MCRVLDIKEGEYACNERAHDALEGGGKRQDKMTGHFISPDTRRRDDDDGDKSMGEHGGRLMHLNAELHYSTTPTLGTSYPLT